MKKNFETDEEIVNWLKKEYAMPFEGWDFSYISSRRTPLGSLPWSYEEMVRQYLPGCTRLLDIDTGGGEVLFEMLSNSGFNGVASAIEPYAPNVKIARNLLNEIGVEVYDTSKNNAEFKDDSFDLVICRHGGSILAKDIYRMLKPGGVFITQQVGDCTNVELRKLFDVPRSLWPGWPSNAKDAGQFVSEHGFVLKEINEHVYSYRYADVGALVYYLKALPSEVPGFSIEKYAETLVALHRETLEKGFAVDASFHSFFLTAEKPR